MSDLETVVLKAIERNLHGLEGSWWVVLEWFPIRLGPPLPGEPRGMREPEEQEIQVTTLPYDREAYEELRWSVGERVSVVLEASGAMWVQTARKRVKIR